MKKLYLKNGFMTGNVISDCQWSGYLRCKQETLCNGFINEPYHLQQYDLNNMPRYFSANVKAHAAYLANERAESVILYCIRHYIGPSYDRRPVVKGYLITDTNGKHLWHMCLNSPHSSFYMDMALSQVAA